MRSALLVVALGLLVSTSAAEDAADVTLGCQPALDSGRIVCHVDYRSSSRGLLVWADALVVEAPPFVRPLRARAPAVVEADGAKARAGLAFVPSSGGSGKISVRARLVSCGRGAGEDLERCRPSERELETTLVVP
jgi:hypothetical protein